jgi:hypothetical protein
MKFCGMPESSRTTRTAATLCNSLARGRNTLDRLRAYPRAVLLLVRV